MTVLPVPVARRSTHALAYFNLRFWARRNPRRPRPRKSIHLPLPANLDSSNTPFRKRAMPAVFKCLYHIRAIQFRPLGSAVKWLTSSLLDWPHFGCGFFCI